MSASSSTTQAPCCARLHQIILTDLDDPYLGDAYEKNIQRLEVVAQDIISDTSLCCSQYQVEPHLFLRGNEDRRKFLQFIQSDQLKVGAKDVIWFHYSGHGIRSENTKDELPDLITSEDENPQVLSLRKVVTLLQEKGAQLLLVVADCCNEVVDGDQVGPQLEPLHASLAPLEPYSCACTEDDAESSSPAVYDSLFRHSAGTVIFCGAQPGAKVTPRASSNLTRILYHSLESACLDDPSMTWETIAKLLDTRMRRSITLQGDVKENSPPLIQLDLRPFHK